jgi:ribosomal protein L11 methylase PrmA
VEGLTWNPGGTEWADYYAANNNYDAAALDAKAELLRGLLAEGAVPKTVWDLGGNTGRFSRVAASVGAETVCWDIDPSCVEANYQHVKKQGETRVLPLLSDLTNPSPAQGWAHGERKSLEGRGPVDVVLALGLVHHLAISNNLPLGHIAEFFAKLGRSLVIEFVPKEDSQVKKLLATRVDIFPDYTAEGLVGAFSKYFTLEKQVEIPGTVRTLYRWKRQG